MPPEKGFDFVCPPTAGSLQKSPQAMLNPTGFLSKSLPIIKSRIALALRYDVVAL
jgi:hypothetical protein